MFDLARKLRHAKAQFSRAALKLTQPRSARAMALASADASGAASTRLLHH